MHCFKTLLTRSAVGLGGLSLAACAAEATSPPGNGAGAMAAGGANGGSGAVIMGGGGVSPGTGGFTPTGGTSTGGTSTGGTSTGGTSTGGTSTGGTSTGGTSTGGTSTGGVGAGGTVVIGGEVDPVGNDNRAPGFIDLSPPMGSPLPSVGEGLNPPAPAGWQWHPIDGAICRDGSPTGVFVYEGTSNNLVIFLEGGGACSNVPFCRFNPKSADEILAGDGSTVAGSALGAVAGRQQPGAYSLNTPAGIFDHGNAQNPFQNWSMVYVPYCTGDVHFGTKANATVPGTPGADARDIQQHQFVGYYNMEKIIGRVVPTFSTVDRVVLTGSSAGSFGALLNFSMVQDAFGNVPVTALADSGVPFDDQYMFTCMQARWRSTWGLALPADCTECQQADGGGLLGMSDFLIRKHPNAYIGIISMMQDEVMRLFFSVGLQNCGNYETADPVAITLGQADPNVYMAATLYEGGLNGLRAQYGDVGRLATFYMAGQAPHQLIFRPNFYTATATPGGKTVAGFVSDLMGGTLAHLGP